MAGWLSIINASDEDFNKLTGAIDNCDGSAQSMAEIMQDNLSGQLTIHLLFNISISLIACKCRQIEVTKV